jgi:predicted RNA-binding protein with PUA-like domain
MSTFLVKTEPDDYSFADLVKDKKTVWSGVSNAAALGHLRSIHKGDQVLIYHTGDEKAIVGLAEAVTDPYEDPKQKGKTPEGKPKFAVVDLKPIRAATSPATLAQIKADKRFKELGLVKIGRLSVMPIPPDLDKPLRTMAGL